MDTPLPSNETLIAYSQALPWQLIEDSRRAFNAAIAALNAEKYAGPPPLDRLSEAVGLPLTTYDPPGSADDATILLAQHNGQAFILGSAVTSRYRAGKTPTAAIVPYNLNPAVNHTNLGETDTPTTRMCALGAEVELGLLHPDGAGPSEAEMGAFISHYETHARRLGITPQIDREACQFQVEAHVAPGVGYQQTRASLDGIMVALMAASEATGLITAIQAAYPIESDFTLTRDPKVDTAVDLMVSVNNLFPEYLDRLAEAKARYQISPDANVVQVFRIQGCHVHLDLAGRSEALGLLAFYTVLRSATAIANSAFLKGGPFVNGVCDAERLCVREYLRGTTVTGRYLEIPVSPHLTPYGMEDYGDLLRGERANSTGRGLLCEKGLGQRISAMHNPIGRIRPDLGGGKRICTLESTGMPVNASASRQAAVLTDFEFSHALIENYFRQHGCDLEAMFADRTMWSLLGPLDHASFAAQHDESDRRGSDIAVTTATGDSMSLSEFYAMKRIYMHKHLIDVAQIRPRDIDDVYSSIQRMLNPPSGQHAQTVEQYISDPKLRSTGNWGQILRDAFIEEGGTPGTQNSEAVLRVTKRVHNALRQRYMEV